MWCIKGKSFDAIIHSTKVNKCSSPLLCDITTIGIVGHTTTLEVHLIDYHADLYGHRLTVGFRHWLRPEQPFSTPEALAQQLQSDREAALRVLSLQSTKI